MRARQCLIGQAAMSLIVPCRAITVGVPSDLRGKCYTCHCLLDSGGDFINLALLTVEEIL